MTPEEEISELKKTVTELNIRMMGQEMILKILQGALEDLGERLARDEDWLTSVSALARHALTHVEETHEKKQSHASVETPLPAPKKNEPHPEFG